MDKSKVQEMINKASDLELELVWIPRIMERQTYDEVVTEATKEKNNIGLNGRDAPIVSSIYRQIKEEKHLSPRQADYLRRALVKYSGQYLSMMNGAN